MRVNIRETDRQDAEYIAALEAAILLKETAHRYPRTRNVQAAQKAVRDYHTIANAQGAPASKRMFTDEVTL
jgi:hypothetical protein